MTRCVVCACFAAVTSGCFGEAPIVGNQDRAEGETTQATGFDDGASTGDQDGRKDDTGGSETTAPGASGSESESESESESGLEESDGGRVPICGDGIVEVPETCDAPVELVAGGCAADCSLIETRRIVLSDGSAQGDLGRDPVAFADARCPRGYRAMFAFGESRRATVAPGGAIEPIDWVQQPYTAYVNAADEPLWVTDDIPLLGVRDGLNLPLQTPLASDTFEFGVANGNGRELGHAGWRRRRLCSVELQRLGHQTWRHPVVARVVRLSRQRRDGAVLGVRFFLLR